MIFCIGLSPNVHPLINGSLSWKVVSIQGVRIGRRHFHHLKMNSYLHQKYHLEKGPYYLSNETEGSM